MIQVSFNTNRITKRYEELLADYLKTDVISSFQNDKNESILQDNIVQEEQIAISDFLKSLHY